jgi:predicted HNH restriction endonuclease
MPKKNSIINNTPPQEKILIEDEETPQQPELTKPKRQISDAQREHLNNIRSKALEKKAQMKEETLKAKLAQTLEKKELVKKYDEYAEKEKETSKPNPQSGLFAPKGGYPEKKETQKPKEKKIVYKLAESSSSESSDNDEEEVVYVKKIKNKKENKKQIYHNKQENNQPHSGDMPYGRDTLDSTLYKSSQEMLHKRAIEERVRANLVKWNNAMMPQEY